MRVAFALTSLCSTKLLAAGAASTPCCQTCDSGYAKYYSIPSPDEVNPVCGECCLQPSRYEFWKLFEPKLLKGDCASQGFTKYTETESDGVGPLSVTNDRYERAEDFRKSRCPQRLNAVYADMHDGDEKEVVIAGALMTIRPRGNNQTWVVETTIDAQSCSAVVDFNVPGKPGPPPVNLTATLWYSFSAGSSPKSEFEYIDPSGTLAGAGFPLNRWVELGKDSRKEASFPFVCPDRLKAVYADMHDGDQKAVTISGSSVKIEPYGNNETWVVNAKLDVDSCSAIIDFNVPGKPGPPPVNLTATLLRTRAASTAVDGKSEFEFTDPSGTLAIAGFPLNHWVEIGRGSLSTVISV